MPSSGRHAEQFFFTLPPYTLSSPYSVTPRPSSKATPSPCYSQPSLSQPPTATRTINRETLPLQPPPVTSSPHIYSICHPQLGHPTSCPSFATFSPQPSFSQPSPAKPPWNNPYSTHDINHPPQAPASPLPATPTPDNHLTAQLRSSHPFTPHLCNPNRQLPVSQPATSPPRHPRQPPTTSPSQPAPSPPHSTHATQYSLCLT
ncbi:uncharacterized protein LOC134443479 [Engraulis encrasicolus]|uniref:uncharacterized protein LOC134443479 n=1 Tax=Engraulis encrasicolus TaxID=184585 RepID=UPI002FD6455D